MLSPADFTQSARHPQVFHGDSREVLKTFPDAVFDSVVCDPPYALVSIVKRFGSPTAAPAKGNDAYTRASAGFMSQTWDTGETAFAVEFWAEVFRVLKPGGHVIAFSGTRTYHRLAVAIEDAGFEIRDMVAWLYGSGFPKSHDVSKGIDKAAGAMGHRGAGFNVAGQNVGLNQNRELRSDHPDYVAPEAVTDAARQWQGWGTALKPAWESVCLAQKPYALPQLCGIVAHKVAEALCQLPSYAKDAEPSSSSSPSGFDGAFASAPWSAVAGCNTPDDLFALMDTWPSELAPPSNLSTAFSWLRTLAALSRHGSTFTTETASSLTTDLRTLKSLLSKNTLDTMARAVTPQNGTSPDASLVRSLFSVAEARLLCIQGLSAVDPATFTEDGPDLRPNLGPCVLARKPLSGTVAQTVLQHGTGALNIDASRIGTTKEVPASGAKIQNGASITRANPDAVGTGFDPNIGRWPANVITDGSEEVVGAFPQTGIGQVGGNNDPNGSMGYHGGAGGASLPGVKDGGGSAARYFYSAKADAEDRLGSRHPTVKPVDLMAYLVRLVTPPGGLTLDPFAGSGTTGVGAMREGMRCVLIEREDAYVDDIVRKLAWARGEGRLTTLEQAKLDTPEAQAKAGGADLPLFGDA